MDIEKKVVMDLGSAWNTIVKATAQGRVSKQSTVDVVEILAQRPALLELLPKKSE